MSSTRLVIAAGVILSLLAAVFLLWPSSGVDQAPPRARTTEPARSPPQAVHTPPPPALATSEAPAALPTPSAPAPATSDPFRAFLEAHRGQALPAASQPAASAPIDPFKAAIEAARREKPVPLVSPFGPKR
jgi:hypothetical protein